MNADNLKKEIKKVKVGHIAILCAGIFLAFAIIGSILITVSGGWKLEHGFSIGVGQTFEVNDRADLDMDGVEKIVISSVSDEIILQSGGSKVAAELKGQCRSVTTPVKLDARKQGDTIYIEVKYPNTINSNNTTLTVTIPVEYMGDLSATTVSGSIHAEGLPFKLQQVAIGTVSGSVKLGTASYAKLRATTTSGDVTVSGIVAETSVSSISGSVSLDYAAFAATKVNTVSGDVSATIPQNAAFKVDFGSVSGSFTSKHPGIAVDRAKSGFNGAAAGGTETIKVDTTSGGFSIDGK